MGNQHMLLIVFDDSSQVISLSIRTVHGGVFAYGLKTKAKILRVTGYKGL